MIFKIKYLYYVQNLELNITHNTYLTTLVTVRTLIPHDEN